MAIALPEWYLKIYKATGSGRSLSASDKNLQIHDNLRRTFDAGIIMKLTNNYIK